MSAVDSPPLLEVRDLSVHYELPGGFLEPTRRVFALEKTSFSLAAGETLAIVGESGCGKSTLGKAILGLVEPTTGGAFLEGVPFSGVGVKPPRALRRKMQMVFQDPYSSLNPRRTIGQSVADPLRVGGLSDRSAVNSRVLEALGQVGFGREMLQRYPHELSGGQRQRVAIARAIVTRPRVIICDEPISSLDISIQAQVVNLLEKLQRELGIAYLFITHDLRLVPHIARRVLVMYLGEVVEMAEAIALDREKLHPYTQALFSAIPQLNAVPHGLQHRALLEGEVPSPMNPPGGCRLHARCPQRQPLCEVQAPELRVVGERGVRCHFAPMQPSQKGKP